ncbi:MAG: c-type cytochrome [Pirellulales bacterium]
MGRQFLTVLVILAVPVAITVVAQEQNERTESVEQIGDRSEGAQQTAELSGVKRGRYIVHNVAMCIYCHSPRQPDGTLDRQRLLTGAPMPVSSPFPAQEWAFRAPALAGLPGGWSEAEFVTFLSTGERPGGHPIRPPMPPFQMTQQDAEAVAAYLKSLDDPIR